MVNKYRFTRKNPKTKKIENTGYMEIRNAASGPELYIYGDIVSSSWDAWSVEDVCPQDIADFMNQTCSPGSRSTASCPAIRGTSRASSTGWRHPSRR